MGFKSRKYFNKRAKVVKFIIYCPNLDRNIVVKPSETSMNDPYYHTGLFDDCAFCGTSDIRFHCKCGETHFVPIDYSGL